MKDDNILKFERPKPKPPEKPVRSPPGKPLIWLLVVVAVVLIWAYFQFVAPML